MSSARFREDNGIVKKPMKNKKEQFKNKSMFYFGETHFRSPHGGALCNADAPILNLTRDAELVTCHECKMLLISILRTIKTNE